MGFSAYYNGEVSITPKPGSKVVLEFDRWASEYPSKLESDCPFTINDDGKLTTAYDEYGSHTHEEAGDWLQAAIKDFFKPKGFKLKGEFWGDTSESEGWFRLKVFKNGKCEWRYGEVVYRTPGYWRRKGY
jgi:hypothetical protein